MESYRYLLDIALILLSTKFLGMLTRKIEMPQVVGALLAGIILGPACLGWVNESELLSSIAEIGVIVLMFSAGLETDIQELKRSGGKSFVIALIGVIVPLLMGFGLASIYNPGGHQQFLENMFVGVILTATSVSISVETLKEIGKLSTPSGNAILGAAIIDDVLGIIALTIISGMADTSVNLAVVMIKIVAFFVFAIVVALVIHPLYVKWFSRGDRVLRRYSIVSFSFALLMAYAAEQFFGVADITGAFVAGLIISGTAKSAYVAKRIDTLSYLLIAPVFFASIGLKVERPDFNMTLVVLTLLLLLVAVFSKIIGCGLGAKICGYTGIQSIRIGSGMVSRGEVALIISSKGVALGLMNSMFLTPVLLVVVVTTIVTPILLKFAFADRKNDPDVAVKSNLVQGYEQRKKIEVEQHRVIEENIRES